MGEDVLYPINDTYRAIQRVMDELKAFESPKCNARIKAIILTNLEQAQLWSLKLVD